MDSLGTVLTVFGSVGFRNEGRVADSTAFFHIAVKDFRFQSGIYRQDGPSEPLAEYGIGNALRTHAGIASVQQDAVAIIIVTAFLPYQGIGSATLFGCHE